MNLIKVTENICSDHKNINYLFNNKSNNNENFTLKGQAINAYKLF